MKNAHVDATPNISKFSVSGGIAGLITTVIFVVIGLIGLPIVRGFLIGAIALGALMAVVIRFTSRARD